jgi:transposase InsO family protein
LADAWLPRACVVLGIKLVHSRPGRAQGRGKIEQFFRTVFSRFLTEVINIPSGRCFTVVALVVSTRHIRKGFPGRHLPDTYQRVRPDRGISFCRFLALARSPSRTAAKIPAPQSRHVLLMNRSANGVLSQAALRPFTFSGT